MRMKQTSIDSLFPHHAWQLGARFLYQVFPGTTCQCERLLLRASKVGEVTTVEKLVGTLYWCPYDVHYHFFTHHSDIIFSSKQAVCELQRSWNRKHCIAPGKQIWPHCMCYTLFLLFYTGIMPSMLHLGYCSPPIEKWCSHKCSE